MCSESIKERLIQIIQNICINLFILIFLYVMTCLIVFGLLIGTVFVAKTIGLYSYLTI